MKNKKAFSFVELIVSVTILAIISTIGFISYSSYLGDSRDSQRKSDLAQVGSALKVYKQKRGYYPVPGNKFELTYNGTGIVFQGKFDENVRLNTLDRLPLDPKSKTGYIYSITKNAQEYEMAATLENEDNPIALVNGTYKSVSRDILPGIMLAIETPASLKAEIFSGASGAINKNKFIFSNQKHNLAYDFVEPFLPQSDGTAIATILNELSATSSYWQNTDYRSCIEIKESGKAIQTDNTPITYQIIDSTTGNLSNRICNCTASTCTGD
ncbi:MAG: prepilin-type N-terminal cleavage/methylation domain-containing protein [Candidatus Gracilibacteria bacterium]|nr:prepilin-type N-terminal cleavage/methylation domain-containing protein [Candidatus Gracilibacteria bacterium]